MGNASTLVAPFPHFVASPYSSSLALYTLYRSRDYDFGVDSTILTSLLSGNTQLSEAVAAKFGGASGIVNAMSFISAVIILSDATSEPDPIHAKVSLIFDLFDFHESKDMALDEVTILLLSVIRAVIVITGTGADPRDETMEQFSFAMFQEADKTQQQFITKKEFTTWIVAWLQGDEFGVDLDFVLKRFSPGALITPEQQAAFELQARLDQEKAEEEERLRKELEIKKRLEIEEEKRKEAEEKVRKQMEEERVERERVEALERAEVERLAAIEAERVRVEAEKARVEAERIAEEARVAKIEADRLAAEDAEKERLAAIEAAEQEEAAVKFQNLKRAKDARTKVAAKRAELAALEKEEADASEATGAVGGVAEALLFDAADIEDTKETNEAATMLANVQRKKLAVAKVEEKRRELREASKEADEAGAGQEPVLQGLLDGEAEEKAPGVLEDLLDDKADAEAEVVKAKAVGRKRQHTVNHTMAAAAAAGSSDSGAAAKAPDALEEKAPGGLEDLLDDTADEEAEVVKAKAAGRKRQHTVNHSMATEFVIEGEKIAEELELAKAKDAGRDRAHTVNHSQLGDALKDAELKRGEKADEDEEKSEEKDAEGDLEKELMAELAAEEEKKKPEDDVKAEEEKKGPEEEVKAEKKNEEGKEEA